MSAKARQAAAGRLREELVNKLLAHAIEWTNTRAITGEKAERLSAMFTRLCGQVDILGKQGGKRSTLTTAITTNARWPIIDQWRHGVYDENTEWTIGTFAPESLKKDWDASNPLLGYSVAGTETAARIIVDAEGRVREIRGSRKEARKHWTSLVRVLEKVDVSSGDIDVVEVLGVDNLCTQIEYLRKVIQDLISGK